MNENIVIVEKLNFLSRGRSLVKMVQIRLGETGASIKVYLEQISSLWVVKEKEEKNEVYKEIFNGLFLLCYVAFDVVAAVL